MRIVPSTPQLPFPRTATSIPQLSQFDQDMVKALWAILVEYAQRLNGVLPKDGTEAMTGDLNMGMNDIDRILTLTIRRAGAEASQYFTLGPSDAFGHNATGYSATNNAKGFLWNATTDVANTAPSGGANSHEWRIRGSGKLRVEDDGRVNLLAGQLQFPASQVASSGANVLDDYEEGTWTPVVTFATPGDLTVVYSGQTGRYCKIGNRVVVTFSITTTTFTHTTASGECRITGLPFASAGGASVPGALTNGNNITYPAGRTFVQFEVSNGVSYGRPIASGSGTSRATLTPTEMPTASTVVFLGSATYEAAN